jgi:hypothetical protein
LQLLSGKPPNTLVYTAWYMVDAREKDDGIEGRAKRRRKEEKEKLQ